MESAGVVRREFVKDLLARKPGTQRLAELHSPGHHHHPEIASGYQGEVAPDMIGTKTEDKNGRWGWNPLRDQSPNTTARPEFSLIALISAWYEKTITKDSWR